jgi:hypothetical protein
LGIARLDVEHGFGGPLDISSVSVAVTATDRVRAPIPERPEHTRETTGRFADELDLAYDSYGLFQLHAPKRAGAFFIRLSPEVEKGRMSRMAMDADPLVDMVTFSFVLDLATLAYVAFFSLDRQTARPAWSCFRMDRSGTTWLRRVSQPPKQPL